MAVSAVIDKGQITNMGSADKNDKSKQTNAAAEYKEQFMQLLVAQMKYQDPMEPTSNTEWVSQYATFSQVEQMSNMASTMEFSRASDLVGKYVVVGATDENGLSSDIEGVVDSVSYSGNKAYVQVGGRSFLASDVTNVMSESYRNAVETVNAFKEEMDKLPTLENLTLDDANTIGALSQIYNSFTSEMKAMLDPSYAAALKQYEGRIEALREVAAENAEKPVEAPDATAGTGEEDPEAGAAEAGETAGTGETAESGTGEAGETAGAEEAAETTGTAAEAENTQEPDDATLDLITQELKETEGTDL